MTPDPLNPRAPHLAVLNITRYADDPDQAQLGQVVRWNGVDYLPAHQSATVLTEADGTSPARILLLANVGPCGLAVPLSPVTARETATMLVAFAESLEGDAAEQASAALAMAGRTRS